MIVSDANDFDDGNDVEVVDLVNLLNNIRLDKPKLASTKVEEANELLILDCTKHIDMARAQRFPYQSFYAAAVCNAKNGVEYQKRKTTFTVDFGQNIQVPCYNSEQPGCTYYYTPMTANNFGIVNHSHNYDYGNGTIQKLFVRTKMSVMKHIFAPLLLRRKEPPMHKQHCRSSIDTMKSF
jgi:hypothetical protein